MKLFGTDGVRGEAGKELTAESSLRLGLASGIYFRNTSKTNKIMLGKDTRRSGYMIENAIVSGLTAGGYDVIQVGPMPTPAIAFLTEDMRCDAGIVISASHNPFYDNGIKFFNRYGNKLDEDAEEEIEQIFQDESLLKEHQKTGHDIGYSKRIDDVIGRYIVHIKNSFPKELSLHGLRIVIDCANGAAYKVAPTVFSELGADVITINDEPNGYNINENCGAMSPSTLCEHVVRFRADIGFALDGDADRLVVVDEKGSVVDGDKLIGALALYLKESEMLKSDGVAATVMSNLALEEFLEAKDMRLFRSSVGDKYVLELMQKNHLNFGGEQSGHIIFGDFAKTGDGLVSALQTLALLIKSNKKASEVLNPFDLYPQLLENIKVKTKKPLEQIDGLDGLLKEIASKKIRHLIRYSGTENKLRVLLEGKKADELQKECDNLVEFLTKALNG